MFYSHKNLPITLEAYNSSGIKDCEYSYYNFVAQNASLSINPSANFTFPVNYKKPYRGFNTEGLTSTIQLSFISQVPYDNVFFDNIFAENGIKNNFKIAFGDSVFESGYLRSFSASIEPNNLIQNQAEFIFYNTGTNGFNPFKAEPGSQVNQSNVVAETGKPPGDSGTIPNADGTIGNEKTQRNTHFLIYNIFL